VSNDNRTTNQPGTRGAAGGTATQPPAPSPLSTKDAGFAASDEAFEAQTRITGGHDVGIQFKKVLVALRLYAEGHSKRKDAVEGLHRAMKKYLDEFGDLTLHVRPTSLLLDDKPILSDPDPKDSVTRALFSEGLQRASFKSSLEPAELEFFVLTWSQALDGKLPEGHSFVTRVWEEDLQTIRIDAMESFAEGVEDAEEQKKEEKRQRDVVAMVEEISASSLAGNREDMSRSVSVSMTDVAALQMDTVVGITAETLETQDVAKRPPMTLLSAEDSTALASEMMNARRDVPARAFVALWGVLQVASEEERAEIVKLARATVTLLAINQRMEELDAAMASVKAQSDADPSLERNYQAFLDAVCTPQVLAAVVSHLDGTAYVGPALNLLSSLPGTTVETLLDLLPTLKTQPGRGNLALVLSGKQPPVKALVARLQSWGPVLAPHVFALSESLGAEDQNTFMMAAFQNRSSQIRVMAVNHIKKEGRQTYKNALLRLSEDREASVRQAVLNIYLRAKDPDAVPLLVTMLNRAGADEDERRSLIRALAMLGGPAAAAALRKHFEAEKDAEVKGSCALALGQVGDTLARPLLEAAGKKLFANKKLKEACAEAIKRLDAHTAASKGGSGG
jgi:HEAT repeat protein